MKNAAAIRFVIGVFAGALIAAVDNFAFEGEVSPIVIVALLLIACGAFGILWRWHGWYAAVGAWICIPMAHVINQVLGLPDTLHPNTYASIAMLAAFTLVISLFGVGLGTMVRRLFSPEQQ